MDLAEIVAYNVKFEKLIDRNEIALTFCTIALTTICKSYYNNIINCPMANPFRKYFILHGNVNEVLKIYYWHYGLEFNCDNDENISLYAFPSLLI